MSNGLARFEVFYKTKDGSSVPMPDKLIVPVLQEHEFTTAAKKAEGKVAEQQMQQRDADAARGTEATPLHAPFWSVVRTYARSAAVADLAIERMRAAYGNGVDAPSYIGKLERKP